MSKYRNAKILDNKYIYCPECGASGKDILSESYGLATDGKKNYYEFVKRCSKCQTIFAYYLEDLNGVRITLNNAEEIKCTKSKEDGE